LKEWVEPLTGQNLITSKSLKRLEIKDDQVQLDVVLGFPLGSHETSIREALTKLIKPVTNLAVQMNFVTKNRTSCQWGTCAGIKRCEKHYCGGSGKGGVGKSTVSFHLAQPFRNLAHELASWMPIFMAKSTQYVWITRVKTRSDGW